MSKLVKESMGLLKVVLLQLTENEIKRGNGGMKCSKCFRHDLHSTIEEVEDVLSLTLTEDNLVDFINFSTLVESHIDKDTVSELNLFVKGYRV